MRKISSLVVTNLLWILCCLPVITAGAATKAMYANLFALRAGEPCSAGCFFRAFAKDFRRVTGLWTLLLAAGAALGVDYYIIAYLDFPGRMAVIALIFFLAFLLLFFSSLALPMLSQFPMSIKDAVVNGVLLCLAHLPKMLLITAMNLLPWALLLISTKLFLILGFVWITCGFGLIGLYNIRFLEKIFAPYREQV